jgi:hypothetical protein
MAVRHRGTSTALVLPVSADSWYLNNPVAQTLASAPQASEPHSPVSNYPSSKIMHCMNMLTQGIANGAASMKTWLS